MKVLGCGCLILIDSRTVMFVCLLLLKFSQCKFNVRNFVLLESI